MFATLHIPDFPVAAALSVRPEDAPAAVLTADADRREKLPLLAVNERARRTGIAAGWPLGKALVRCPDLRVLSRDPTAERTLRDTLLRLGESFTPDLEATAADAVTLDLRHRRAPAAADWERLFLESVELWHARAATPDLAHLAARHPATLYRFVTPDDLAPLPLEVLRALVDPGWLADLPELWGVRTLGDFMALPRQGLAERLGPEAGHWHDVLHGKHRRVLRPHRPPENLAQHFDFEDPVAEFEPLVFALKRLLHALAGRLRERGLAAARLDLRLELTSGDRPRRCVDLPAPRSTVEDLLAPLRSWLGDLYLDAPVVSLALDVEPTFPPAAQREWFGRHLPEPERWAETLAKLDALLGPDRAGIPVPPDGHRPDAFTLHPAAESAGPLPPREHLPPCPVPLHRFRPPRAIAVAHEPHGRRPWPLALLSGPHPGQILDRRGPFPVSGSWWEPADAWQRLEWDIEVEGRHLLRLAFETPDRWLLEGSYR